MSASPVAGTFPRRCRQSRAAAPGGTLTTSEREDWLGCSAAQREQWLQSRRAMAVGIARQRMIERLLASIFLSTALIACEKDDRGEPWIYRLCNVEWRGVLTTHASSFNIQACWNGRCTNDVLVQVEQADGGPSERVDAGCVLTTPKGMPSRCNLVPVAPRPGCAEGEIGGDFSVSVCAQSVRDGTTFDIVLKPATDGFPDKGDRFRLVIETTAGGSLVEATANVGSDSQDTDSSASCQGGLFGLDGSPIE